MKILLVNKYHYPRGGADKYYLELGRELEKAGHEVAYFAMHHPLNLQSKWQKYFLSRVSYNENIWRYAHKIPLRAIYSLEAKRKFKKLLKDFQPDIIHLHNIYYQLSPSILDAATKTKIPTIMHVHDYNLVCPNHSLFVRGKICKQCLHGNYYHCLKKRCVKNSLSASFLGVLTLWIHNNLLKIYQKNIQLLITPSQFMKNILIEADWAEAKIKVINNPFYLNKITKVNQKEKYFIYCGRLSAEKGVDTAIYALKNNKKLQLKIVGSGPEEKSLHQLTTHLNLDKQVSFLGWKQGDELQTLISQAQALLLPSRWLENFPLIALEALALGTPILASKIGGIPEIVNNKNGSLLTVDNIEEWHQALVSVERGELHWSREDLLNSATKFSPERNLQEVLKTYQQIIASYKKTPLK
ncbi:MAG: glycosyltransferase [Patescibacteria group bacterium]|jgi:glycosyltransferase involved in cell wall biosynthesis|nr:glycosyltransferase [Patescibacteria group bacterium]